MEAFGRFWRGNTLMIGIVCTVLALAIAIGLRDGQAATVFGLIAGIAFMWLGNPPRPDEPEEDEA